MQRAAFFGVLAVFLLAGPVFAVEPFPASFKTQEIQTNGTTSHVRVGGSGPAVVLLHGFGDSGDMWAPIAAKLVADQPSARTADGRWPSDHAGIVAQLRIGSS